MNIDWSNAAILAAIVAGAFAITKELIAFVLGAARRWFAEHREMKDLRFRLAQFYMHMAVAAIKSLSSWQATRQVQEATNTLIEPLPPSIDFLKVHHDEGLERDALRLAGDDPDAVMKYFHLRANMESAEGIFQVEHREFQSAPFFFSYPNARRHLRELLVQSVAATEEILAPLEKRSITRRRAIRRYLTAARNLGEQLEDFPPISLQEIQQEQFAGLDKLDRLGLLRRDTLSVP